MNGDGLVVIPAHVAQQEQRRTAGNKGGERRE